MGLGWKVILGFNCVIVNLNKFIVYMYYTSGMRTASILHYLSIYTERKIFSTPGLILYPLIKLVITFLKPFFLEWRDDDFIIK